MWKRQNKSDSDRHLIFAPYSVECILKELSNQPFSISTDASNHKEIKLFPLVIRFFTAANGIQVRLLDMNELPGEDSQLVADFITEILNKHGLKWEKLVSFCADNAPVNFGGSRMQGPNNVFKKLLLKKKNLIPVGCPAHIFHNAAQKGADRLSRDIEAVVFKLASYFKGSTSRHEQLKDVCDFLETNYETIPSHRPTRWLTLGKVIDRILKLWDPLTSLFGFGNKVSLFLEKFFASEESLPILQFLNSIDKWFRIEFLPTNIKWIMLKQKEIDYTDAVELARQVTPEIAKKDELFNEVAEANRMLRQIPEEVFDVDPSETKWQKIFKDNDSLPNLYRLVSTILSIQLANAFVERVFSLCKAQWTDARNCLQVQTVKALLQVRVNFDIDCAGVYKLLIKDGELRKKIQGGEKWK